MIDTLRWRSPWLWDGEYYRHLPKVPTPPNVDADIRTCTALLCVETGSEGQPDRDRLTTIGAAFALVVKESTDAEFLYFVASNRVIQEAAQRGSLYIRVPLDDGSVSDLKTDARRDWIAHSDPKADVALCPVSSLPEKADLVPVSADLMPGDESLRDSGIDIGRHLFSVGLFHARSDDSPVVTVLSFGSIYLMPQLVATGFVGPDGRPLEIEAYLTEWPVWGGSSGSPVFLWSPSDGTAQDTALSLLGVVHSHISIDPASEMDGSAIDSGMVGMDFGLAAVIPAQRVAELLSMGDAAQQRRDAVDARLLGELVREREERMDQLARVGGPSAGIEADTV